MKKFKAVLFDFDGVLADTMLDNFRAWKNAFREYNVDINEEDYFPLEGKRLIEIAKVIGKKYKIYKYSNIVDLKNKYYLKNHCFCFYPGVNELIKLLKERNLLLAIVSASPKEKLEKTVPKEFLNNFDVIISGDDITKGKPDPEPYLMAMKKLKLNPDESVVVENAPLGVESAKKAGLYCIAITSTLDKKYLNGADIIVKNINNLSEFLFSNSLV